MNLIRLERHQHPRPPHHELRQKTVFDSGVREIGQVASLYVDGDRNLQYAIADVAPGSVTLKVDQQTVESAPTLSDPHAGPDEELQRTAREHFGMGAVL